MSAVYSVAAPCPWLEYFDKYRIRAKRRTIASWPQKSKINVIQTDWGKCSASIPTSALWAKQRFCSCEDPQPHPTRSRLVLGDLQTGFHFPCVGWNPKGKTLSQGMGCSLSLRRCLLWDFSVLQRGGNAGSVLIHLSSMNVRSPKPHTGSRGRHKLQ